MSNAPPDLKKANLTNNSGLKSALKNFFNKKKDGGKGGVKMMEGGITEITEKDEDRDEEY